MREEREVILKGVGVGVEVGVEESLREATATAMNALSVFPRVMLAGGAIHTLMYLLTPVLNPSSHSPYYLTCTPPLAPITHPLTPRSP